MSVQAIQGFNQVLEFEDVATTPASGQPNPDMKDASCHLSNASVTLNGATIDVNTFCTDGWQSRLSGLKDLSLNITYVSDAEWRTWYWAAFNSAQPFLVRHYPEGKGNGKQYFEYYAWLSSADDGGEVSAALGGNGSLVSTGKPEFKTQS